MVIAAQRRHDSIESVGVGHAVPPEALISSDRRGIDFLNQCVRVVLVGFSVRDPIWDRLNTEERLKDSLSEAIPGIQKFLREGLRTAWLQPLLLGRAATQVHAQVTQFLIAGQRESASGALRTSFSVGLRRRGECAH